MRRRPLGRGRTTERFPRDKSCLIGSPLVGRRNMSLLLMICTLIVLSLVSRRFVTVCQIGLHHWGPRVHTVVHHSGTHLGQPFTHKCGNERRFCVRCGKNGALMNKCHYGSYQANYRI